MFGQCKSITKNTSNQHKNHIASNILVRMNCEEGRRNFTDTVEVQEKEVSRLAQCLLPKKNTTIPKEWIENYSVHNQANFERISDFCCQGQKCGGSIFILVILIVNHDPLFSNISNQ